MFVIIEAWNNLSAAEKQKPLPEKVALTMKHAGVSITVTSVTDFVAFAIGASTVSMLLLYFGNLGFGGTSIMVLAVTPLTLPNFEVQ